MKQPYTISIGDGMHVEVRYACPISPSLNRMPTRPAHSLTVSAGQDLGQCIIIAIK